MSVYNRPHLLRRTIDSVLAQKGVDLQFLIVNDGSNHETKSILNSYAERPEIRLISQDNLGLTRALIVACDAAEADYLARIDVGDEMLPGRLFEQSRLLDKQPHIGLVCSPVDLVAEEGAPLFRVDYSRAQLRKGITSPLEEGGKTPFHASVMFRRDVYEQVGGYRPQFYFAQDLDLWSRMLEHCDIAVCEKVYTKGVFGVAGISGRYAEEQHLLREIIGGLIQQRAVDDSEEEGLAAAAKIKPPFAKSKNNDFAGHYFVGKCLLDNHAPEARRYLFKAVQARPTSIKAWWAWGRSLLLMPERGRETD